MADAVGFLPGLIELSGSYIKRHLGYTFKFKTKIRDLREKADQIDGQRESLQHIIEEALRQGDEIETIVRNWITRSDRIIEEARAHMQKAENHQNPKCCPNLKRQWQLGREASKKSQGITKLLEEKAMLGPVSFRLPFRPIEKSPGFVSSSRIQTLNLIMEFLGDPDRKKVGIHGMGGVGKTFLADQLKRSVKERVLFDKVVMVAVSHAPDINKLQLEIAGQLDLKVDDEAEVVKQSRLYHKLMEQKRILIILDDIWKPLDLAKVGIPDEDDLNGSKILLISRRKDVLENMGSSSSNNIGLELLSLDEAMDLFKQKAGEIQNYEHAEQIVQKCDGHPLSLVAMGDLVKHKGSHVWEDIINQLSNIPGERIQEKVLSVLELSYNYLSEEQKSVFLLCGLFGQPHISTLDLLKHCWGLDLFRGVYRVVDAWNRLLTLIDDLVDTSLIISFNKDDALIKMHDVVRETAVSIALRTGNAFTVRNECELEKWPGSSLMHNCARICLPNCDVHELPRILECPNLEFFMFHAMDHNIKIPNPFFEVTTNLQVVTLNKIMTQLPTSLESLTNLRTLCLHDCILSEVTFIQSLEKLEVLSFRGSNIHCIPRELVKLTRLKLLDLHNCKWLASFPPLVLSNLSQLEELYMGNTSVDWDSPDNASLSELESLCHLTTLEIQFPAGKSLPESAVSGNLKRYRIGFTRKGSLDRLPAGMKTLLFPTGSVLPQDLKVLLTRAERLEIGNIRGMTNVHFDMNVDVLDNIRYLLIVWADDLDHLVCSTHSDLLVFPILESLWLINTKKLKSLCNGRLSTGSLRHLKTLTVYKCDSLKYVFSLSIAESLEWLESLDISFCDNLEEIIYVDENDYTRVASHSLKLPRLVSLDLSFLPRLRGFICRDTTHDCSSQSISEDSSLKQPLFSNEVLFPLLESLGLNTLPEVKAIWPDQLDNRSFTKLKQLQILSCGCLETVFQAAIAKQFMELSKLEIRDCERLREIFKFPMAEVEEDRFAILESKLAFISLEHMLKLESIWGNEPSESINLQCLESIIISDCQSLKAAFPSTIASQLKQLKVLHLSKIGFKEIVSHEECGGSSPLLFSWPQLTSLKLECLSNLEAFCQEKHELQVPKLNSLSTTLVDHHGQFSNAVLLTENVFLNLAELSLNGNLFTIITESPNLINLVSKVTSLVLFTFEGQSLMSSSFLMFSRLEKLYIRDSKIDNIFVNGIDDGHGELSLMHPPDSLRCLKIDNVACLETLTLTSSFLQKLENLQVYRCCDVMYIKTTSFRNLSSLTIDRCDKLVTVLPFSIAKYMQQLVKMTITSCSSLIDVVCADEGQLVDVEPQLCINFSKLKTLVLEKLSSLASFCSVKFMFQFPSLEEVTVMGCPNMEVFSPENISTPKLKNVVGTLWQCAADLNSTISKLYSEMVGFQDLEEINLSKFPQLIEKWHGEIGFKFCPLLQKVVIDNCVSSSEGVPLRHFAAVTLPWQLIIENCESMEEIFCLEGIEATENRAVSLIWLMKLNNLPNLRNTWNIASINILRFEFLKFLHIQKCDNLDKVFTLSSALVLSSLEYLSVENCASLSMIIKRGAEEEMDWDGHTLFPFLKLLSLNDLPRLERFCESDCVFKIHSLTTIGVVGCPNFAVFDSTGSNDIPRLFNGQVEIRERLEDIQICLG